MKELSNLIAILGIVFPNPIGYFTLFYIFIKDLFKKLTKPFLINKNYKISSILTLIFLTIHFIIPITKNNFIFNPEIKSIFFFTVITLLLINKKLNNELKLLNPVFNIIIIYSFIGFIFSVIFNQQVLRFPDHLIIFKLFAWNSVYFGAFFVIVFSISKLKFHKISSFILVLLSGSGTSLIGLLFVIFSRNYIYIKTNLWRILLKKRFLAALILVLIILSIIFLSQMERGRNIMDVSTIDRYVIQSSFLSYYFSDFSILKFLVGKGFNNDIREFINYVDKDSFTYGYIVLKLSKSEGAAILHSEPLRIINNFGIIGYGIFIRQIFLLVDKDKIIFFALLLMGLFTSICFTNSIFILLITLYNYKINNIQKY